ncbi:MULTISPECIES: hypothetical protein [Prochlorococcus]|uniref:hypothetical protein n=1 Tax=Prochlorococcus TaxID=1218 RepID=UPI000533B3EB|nr:MULTISPECIES: hypothetical protein [Prochlorococcus]KGG12078.1 hypothetical protein EV05_1281 [Prochlorococcus sp. MIT 0601]
MLTRKLSFNVREYLPLLILLGVILPLAILLNPNLIPRLLGQTSHISKYGYLDMEHYIFLAQNKYIDLQRTAYYPLWPFLLSTFTKLTSLEIYKATILLSSIFGILSITLIKPLFYRVSNSRLFANCSFYLYTLSPMTVVFFMGYTESIFAFQSIVLLLSMHNILTAKIYRPFSLFLNYLVIFASSILLSLTRPILIQTIFSIALSISFLIIANKIRFRFLKKYLFLSSLILLGTFAGYVIYGNILVDHQFRFFEPFYAQEMWNKSLGFRPIYFLTSKSPLIDFWALYYPFILLIGYFNGLSNYFFRKISTVPFRKLALTLLYPPIGIISGIFSNDISKRTASENLDQPKNTLITTYTADKDFLFYFSTFFAFSHSLICFLTQPFYMASLGRYVFGQPFFYLSLCLFLNNRIELISIKQRYLFLATLFISSLYLLINFINYANADFLP